jgi:dipeptidyl aminopeptidase/acylaminoacyl peptidase
MAALRGRLNGSVRAVVALYSPSDLVSLARSLPVIPRSIRNSIDGNPWLGFVAARLRSLSPLEHVTNDSPPFLLIHGTADPLVPFEQSVRMCDKLRRMGAQCELYPVEGAGHGIRRWDPLRDDYKRHMVAWLERHLEEPAGRSVQPPGGGPV